MRPVKVVMPQPPPVQKKILVVDDEPAVCDTIKMLLEFDGHEVVAAADGSGAIALFEQNRFDLVITDYTMPGMMGDKLAQRIKAAKPEQPVIMLTAHAEMLLSRATPLTGVDQLVSKPFQLAELRRAIQQVMEV